MDHVYNLFDALRSFDNRRRYNRKTYDEYVKSQERFKGSEGYQKDVADAAARRKAADDESRAAAAKTINDCLQKMRENAGQLTIEAPTAEMVHMLTVLNMKTRENRPSKQLLDMIAQSMNGNYLALSALNDIADKFYPKTDVKGKAERFHHDYTALATGINSERIYKILKDIADGAREILDSPVKSVFIDQARMRQHKYGAAFSVDDLPQREPLTDERAFYGNYVPAEEYELFMQAVKDK